MRHGPHLNLVALVVREYDPAIDFFVRILRFELVEDVPSLTNDGRPKRWVVVRPPGAATGILIAKADGEEQERIVGNQFAGRVEDARGRGSSTLFAQARAVIFLRGLHRPNCWKAFVKQRLVVHRCHRRLQNALSNCSATFGRPKRPVVNSLLTKVVF